ncbi:hypothetical protein Tco_0879574 [Tanacetum coccineum]
MSLDEELAQNLHEEEQARFNKEQEAEFDAEDNVLARIAADEDFVQQLQVGEKCSEEDLPMKLVELFNQRKKFFVQQRAEAKRNKPMTPAQQKEYMSNYIKNQEGGYSIKQLKSLSFEQERFSTTKPTDDKEMELWVKLKTLFDPDDGDTIWKLQRYMRDPLVWRLYDTCGVHHVSSVKGHDIFMLVEKDYLLSKALMMLMLVAKLSLK